MPYLTAVGELKRQANNMDLMWAWEQICQQEAGDLEGETLQALQQTLELKQSLLLRPLETLLAEPHMLSGWLSVNRDCYTVIDGCLSWNENPVGLLSDTYHYLNMDYVAGNPAATMIWDHDNEILQDAIDFYDELNNRLLAGDWIELQSILAEKEPPAGLDSALWQQIRAAHRGYQAGSGILALLPFLAETTGYFELSVNADLSIHIPERLDDPVTQEAMAKVLAPPPIAKSDEILAQTGGMFYSRETPDHEPYINEGDHFEAGDPLFIVEVMKMFNKVYAPFAGTVDKVMVATDGVIIRKGQPIFKITPDEKVVAESPEDIAARRRKLTREFLLQVSGPGAP
jgi:biotin carboxyl carrier protein